MIQAVAKHNDKACIALCEHPKWGSLPMLLRLVSCSVSISLKTDILLTLAALATLKETALQLWFNIESNQIISTSENSCSTISCCIESEIAMEIDKTESSYETYSLTQAFLGLLYTLSSAIMPKNLGFGSRKPGIYPYFNFVLKSIFLNFYNRYATKMCLLWILQTKVCY